MFSKDAVGTKDATLDLLAWCRRENILKLAEFIVCALATWMIFMGTPTVLLASGSNAHRQLANSTIDDSHRFCPCNFVGCLSGRLPPDTRQIVTTTQPPPAPPTCPGMTHHHPIATCHTTAHTKPSPAGLVSDFLPFVSPSCPFNYYYLLISLPPNPPASM